MTYKGLSTPEWTRTTGPQLRRLMLYPTELRAQMTDYKSNTFFDFVQTFLKIFIVISFFFLTFVK